MLTSVVLHKSSTEVNMKSVELIICKFIYFLKSASQCANQPPKHWVMEIRGSQSSREDHQEWWLTGKQESLCGTSLSRRIIHRPLVLAGFVSDRVTLSLCLPRLRWWEWGPRAGAAVSVLERGSWWVAAPLQLVPAQEAKGPCYSSSLNCGAMQVWRGRVPTSRSRNGSWTAAREPRVWTPEVMDPQSVFLSYYFKEQSAPMRHRSEAFPCGSFS